MRPVLLALVFLLALPACAPRGADVVDGPVESVAALEAELGASGLLLQPRGFSTDPLVAAPANEYALGGSGSVFLQVYTFDSEAEAAQNLNEIGLTGAPGRVSVYQNGPLVVAYYGGDPGVGAALTRVLGPPRL
jgi:hypothetical protein